MPADKEHVLVSVLMTAYNREKYIGEAIESVLASTYPYFELIITDDCSQDKTVHIARQYEAKDSRIKVYQNEKNLGDYFNRNHAASLATGKYLKYVDSDDLIYPHGLAVFVNFMESHPEVALGISSRHMQLSVPFPTVLKPEETIRTHFFKYGFLDTGPTGVIIRTDAFRALSGFTGIRMIGDTQMWMRIAMSYPIGIITPGLIFWRIHEGQEFQHGVNNDIYVEYNYKLILDVFKQSNDKILNQQEKIQITRQQQRALVRHIFKSVFRKKRLKYYLHLWKNLGFGITELKYLVS
jgi:glycosyltransferase involved in cell wall biosynthesis